MRKTPLRDSALSGEPPCKSSPFLTLKVRQTVVRAFLPGITSRYKDLEILQVRKSDVLCPASVISFCAVPRFSTASYIVYVLRQ